MHPNYCKANQWSAKVIGAAIEVHRLKGPGLLESIYQKCLVRELSLREIPPVSQLIVPIEYKGFVFDEPLRLDFYSDCSGQSQNGREAWPKRPKGNGRNKTRFRQSSFVFFRFFRQHSVPCLWAGSVE